MNKILPFLDQDYPTRTVEIPDTGRDDLAKLFFSLGFTTGAEIGTEKGVYAQKLCDVNPDLKLFCIDPFQAYPDYKHHTSQGKLDNFYGEAKRRLEPYNAEIVKDFSVKASKRFKNESLDFVYIDGNHDLFYFFDDLRHWVPKVKKGGIVSGHDYSKRRNPSKYQVHIVEALDAYTQSYDVKPLFVLGSKKIVEGETRDKPRSWFFVKE